MKANILCGPFGWYVEFYKDDDSDSGYGDNAYHAIWYGSREECEAARKQPPKNLRWMAIAGREPDRSPGSAAWAESQGDNF